MVTVRHPAALLEGLHWSLRPLKQQGCLEASDKEAKRSGQMWWFPDVFWCVGSTPGEIPVNPGDLSDEDAFFSDFCVARINAGSETLLMAVGRSLISELLWVWAAELRWEWRWEVIKKGRKSSLWQEQHVPFKGVTQPCHLAEPAGKKASDFKSYKWLVEKPAQVGDELLSQAMKHRGWTDI